MGGQSEAHAINSSGQIVGISYYVDPPYSGLHAFLWQDGIMTDLGSLIEGAASKAYDINDSALIVGETQGGRWQPLACVQVGRGNDH